MKAIPILYSIWLNTNCSLWQGAYGYYGRMYYTDSNSDMTDLFNLFMESDLYPKSEDQEQKEHHPECPANDGFPCHCDELFVPKEVS